MIVLADWLEQRWEEPPPTVVGVGNRLRRDDGAGSCVAERLRARGYAAAFDAETVPENYLGALIDAAPATVLFVDAADLVGAPGEFGLASVDELAPRLASTHAPSLALLAGLLERLGIECWLLGIQPVSTAPGAELSPEVERAVGAIVEALAGSRAREASRV